MTQIRVGWRAFVTSVVNAVDADAQAFISAAGITNLTQAAAINTLVNDLKTYGIWSKMKAIYPFVGGSATSHKFNLKDPRDLDAAFRLVFNGGWTMENSNDISAYNSGTQCIGIDTRWSDGKIYGYIYRDAVPYNIVVTNSSSAGLISLSRTSTTMMKIFRNTSILGTTTTAMSGSVPNISIRLSGSTVGSYSTREKSFTYIGNGLSDIDITNLYTTIQKFQTTLGRHVGSPIVSDSDAQAFLNAAGITDLGQATAVNTLVVDLKAAGIWTKMKAIYPFVGGTATTHKFNLKDPRDLDAAFRLVFNGGWTHSSTGAKPNGTTAYADTKLNVNTALDGTNSHLSYYSRTTVIPGSGKDNYMIGSYDILNSRYYAIDIYGAAPNIYAGLGGFVNPIDTPVADTRGLFIIKKEANTQKAIINNSVIGTKTETITVKPNYNVGLGAAIYNSGIYGYSTFESAFASIGDGLTDAEATAFYTAVQKFNTTLGRQIGTPVLESGQTANLLDTYSSAAAAYSLRKLRTGYYGFAIRVRRSSDNLEQDISFDANGNLDTTSLLAFVGSGNGFVTTWYDQSGNNQHATQTTATNQPSIVLSGVLNTQNSKPVILTDGSSFMINSSASWNLTTNSIFATIKLNASRGAMAMMSSVGTSNQHFVSRNANGTGRYYDSAGQEITAAALPNGFNLISIHENSSGVTVFENGANLVTNFAHDIGGAVTGVVIFKRDAGNGLTSGSGFSELIIYGSTSQLSNNSAINTNINSYYSVY